LRPLDCYNCTTSVRVWTENCSAILAPACRQSLHAWSHYARRTRPFRLLKPFLKGMAEDALYCAHPPKPRFPSQGQLGRSSSARVERAHSYRARSASRRTARPAHPILRPRVARAQKIIRLHPFLCSASKKGTWPLPATLPRPRVARAQEINRPHPTLCSGSTGSTWVSVHSMTSTSSCRLMHAFLSFPRLAVFLSSPLEWATLRGPHALLDSPIPALSRAMRRDVQRWSMY
jgi:hypothetical protein